LLGSHLVLTAAFLLDLLTLISFVTSQATTDENGKPASPRKPLPMVDESFGLQERTADQQRLLSPDATARPFALAVAAAGVVAGTEGLRSPAAATSAPLWSLDGRHGAGMLHLLTR